MWVHVACGCTWRVGARGVWVHVSCGCTWRRAGLMAVEASEDAMEDLLNRVRASTRLEDDLAARGMQVAQATADAAGGYQAYHTQPPTTPTPTPAAAATAVARLQRKVKTLTRQLASKRLVLAEVEVRYTRAWVWWCGRGHACGRGRGCGRGRAMGVGVQGCRRGG